MYKAATTKSELCDLKSHVYGSKFRYHWMCDGLKSKQNG